MKQFTSPNGEPPSGGTTSAEVEALARALDASGCFHRDSRLGRIYHRGAVSYRELRPTDSLHVVIDASRVSVHVDRVSPLKRRPDGSARLSLTRVLAHNLAGAHGKLSRRLRRPAGSPRRVADRQMATTLSGERS